jgi:carboxypeptidase family protein
VQPEDPPDPQQSFLEEEIQTERSEARRLMVRTSIGFVALFGFVFFAFWWSGSAIRFGAARVTATNAPTYRVWGTVRDAQSGLPIPWAAVEDDSSGDPPYFRTDADATGAYALLTLATPHRVRISAVGYRAVMVRVGKPWFIWWPRGEERFDTTLQPD